MISRNTFRANWGFWLLCLIPIIAAFAICSTIVLGLIPIYLATAGTDIQIRKTWTESAGFVYDLPININSQIVSIRDEQLSENHTMILQQIFNNKLASNTHTNNVNMKIIKAITNSIEQRVLSNENYVRLIKGQSGQPKDTTYQLHVDMNMIFPFTCLQRCRKKIVQYIADELFLNIDLDIGIYISIFVNTTLQQTTILDTTVEKTTILDTTVEKTTMLVTTVEQTTILDTTAEETTVLTPINCIPDKSKDILSLATVTLLNADESQFNNPNTSLILQLSCPVLDIYNYSISVNDVPIINSTNTLSNITIFDKFVSEKVILSFVALDIYGLPIFVSFDLYYGSISMPVYVSFQNGTAAAGVLVYANLTDNPTVSQSGYTNSNGTIIFTHVPLRTVALFARTIDNQIALTGIAPTTAGISLVLIPFGTVVSPNTTGNSISKAPSSNEEFLRRITKRDVELPGFTVNTFGETLQMVSKTFMTEKNSTSVYVRYKFVTSEVPGGFFGTQFNDYFSVTIRSQSGYYATISKSMNALGLGAFDFASGATDWYTLKLEVSKDSELIQVDVGVANVGDSAYQSHVIVDKIVIEKCEKCDDCDKCQNPMCQDTCMNPPMKSCLFYTDCMEATVSCGATGYALGYGAKYCNKYVNRLSSFTSQGQDWIYKTMNCLQKALVTPLKDCNSNCQTLRQTAFASHPTCYVNAGVCDLPVIDYLYIFQTVGKDLFNEDGFVQAILTGKDCLPTIIVRISEAIIIATPVLKLQLLIMQQVFKSLK